MYDINGRRPAKALKLGNVNPGDGVRFHGRGYVQLTGADWVKARAIINPGDKPQLVAGYAIDCYAGISYTTG
jgi:predicted chitinase